MGGCTHTASPASSLSLQLVSNCSAVQIRLHSDPSIVGELIAAVLNAPGSWHDSRVARPVYDALRNQTPPGFFLVADTAFPRGARERNMPDRIKAPLKAGDRVPAEAGAQAAVMGYNRQLLTYRQTAEWGMRDFQGSFPRLRLPLPISDVTWRQDMLENMARMHQLRVRRVGVNQIRNVYQPIWKAAEDERLWMAFEHMVFGDVRAGDRVARFHGVAQ
jgi:hypothetical protein